jgi:hypothetical protein
MGWKLGCGAAVLIVGAVSMFSPAVPTQMQDARTAADSAAVREREEGEMIVAARMHVKQRLKDPESAQFGQLTVRNNVVCGTVNSKNSFGGYTGPERFYAFGSLVFFDNDFRDLKADEVRLPMELKATCMGAP